MYITGNHRYDNYTTRQDVYLFTLRDYCEVILDKFYGKYLERDDMFEKNGYLLQVVDIDRAKEYFDATAESSETPEGSTTTTYVLPHLEGNEFPVYVTLDTEVNAVYVGLTSFPEALANMDRIPADEPGEDETSGEDEEPKSDDEDDDTEPHD